MENKEIIVENEVKFYANKTRYLKVAIYTSIAATLLVLISFGSGDLTPNVLDKTSTYIFYRFPILFTVFAVFYYISAILNIINIFRKDPIVIVNDKGILYDMVSKGKIFIEWKDINDIKLLNVQRGKFIGIYTKSKTGEKYMIKKYILNYYLYGVLGYAGVPPISIKEDAVKYNLEEMQKIFKEYISKNK